MTTDRDLPTDAASPNVSPDTAAIEAANAHAQAVLADHVNLLLRLTPEQHAELDRLAQESDDVDTVGVWRRGDRG